MKPDPSTLNAATGTMPSTSAGFHFPEDFCGLDELIERLIEEADNAPEWSTSDSLQDIADELYRLQDGLELLRLKRQGKSEEAIDLFLDLLRGFSAEEER